jgi:hypothetical protein
MLTLCSFRAGQPALVISLVVALFGLAACKTTMVPPCPIVRVDSATASLTQFRDGPGREAGDIEYQADIRGFKGQCQYDDGEVEVSFDVDFAVTGGAAAKGGQATFYYFVAIPQFFPNEDGKRVLSVASKLPAAPGRRETFTESGVRVTIPLKEDQAGAAFDVYVGFQLNNAQLEYNRSRANR